MKTISNHHNTNFVGVNFASANLENALFWGCDLRGCNFTNANLTNTRMIACDLRGTKFATSQTAGLDLSGSVYASKACINDKEKLEENTRAEKTLIEQRKIFKLENYYSRK